MLLKNVKDIFYEIQNKVSINNAIPFTVVPLRRYLGL